MEFLKIEAGFRLLCFYAAHTMTYLFVVSFSVQSRVKLQKTFLLWVATDKINMR